MIYGGRESDLEIFSVVLDPVQTSKRCIMESLILSNGNSFSLKYLDPKTCLGLFY